MLTNIQWRDGRRGVDGWGRYTRRRKWYRDAELVEVTPSTDITPIPTPKLEPVADTSESSSPSPSTSHSHGRSQSSTSNTLTKLSSSSSATTGTDATLRNESDYAASVASEAEGDAASTKSKRGWFKKRRSKSYGGIDAPAPAPTIASSTSTNMSRRSDEDDLHTPLERTAREDEWRLGDDIRMQLDI